MVLCCCCKVKQLRRKRRREERKAEKEFRFMKYWGKRGISQLRTRSKPPVTGRRPRYDLIPQSSVLRKKKTVQLLGGGPNLSLHRTLHYRRGVFRMSGIPFWLYYVNDHSRPMLDIQTKVVKAYWRYKLIRRPERLQQLEDLWKRKREWARRLEATLWKHFDPFHR